MAILAPTKMMSNEIQKGSVAIYLKRYILEERHQKIK